MASTEEKDANDSISASTLRNILQAEIGNRQTEYQKVWEKLRCLEAEIAGLREAQDHIDRLARATH